MAERKIEALKVLAQRYPAYEEIVANAIHALNLEQRALEDIATGRAQIELPAQINVAQPIVLASSQPAEPLTAATEPTPEEEAVAAHATLPVTPALRPPRPETCWAEVVSELQAAREARKRATALERNAFDLLDGFIEAYGDVGRKIAGKYMDQVGHYRAKCEVADAYGRHDKAIRAAMAEEEEAREAIFTFRRTTAQEARRLYYQMHAAATTKTTKQAQSLLSMHHSEVEKKAEEHIQRVNSAVTERRRAMTEASRYFKNLADEFPSPPALSSRPRICCGCGMRGVDRGRECPNLINHDDFQYERR